MACRSRSPAALLVDCNKRRVPAEDARQRLAERDARMAADTRSELQKMLGEPEPSRSALMRVTGAVSHTTPETRRSASGTRVDLWRR
jgi:hypothetical protein